MDAILGLLGICGANCAEERDPEVKGHGGEEVSRRHKVDRHAAPLLACCSAT